jgi:DNA-binding response OmpR family regulator
VIEAATGQYARLRDDERPDLVLLDVNLPDFHGFDVARRIKAAENTRNTPLLRVRRGNMAASVWGSRSCATWRKRTADQRRGLFLSVPGSTPVCR